MTARPDATVFVIDDDPSVRNALERLLRTIGYAVRGFASAEEFLHQEHELGHGCLVLDVYLGRMTGLELLARLGGRASRWPVILVSGVEDVKLGVDAAALGAIAFYQKPFDVGAMLDTIARALGDARVAAD